MTDTEMSVLVERLIRWTVEYERSPTGAKGDERNLAKDALLAAILALQQRVRELEQSLEAYKFFWDVATAIPTMTNGQLEELKSNCRAAIAEGGKHDEA